MNVEVLGKRAISVIGDETHTNFALTISGNLSI
jgi:hypothetical protein